MKNNQIAKCDKCDASCVGLNGKCCCGIQVREPAEPVQDNPDGVLIDYASVLDAEQANPWGSSLDKRWIVRAEAVKDLLQRQRQQTILECLASLPDLHNKLDADWYDGIWDAKEALKKLLTKKQ